jgi:hypothetical protein
MSPEERTPEQIRADIDKTRKELGDTVESLAEKTDVKAQAKAKVEEVKEQARRDPKPFAIAGGVVVLFLLWRWRRS